MGYVEERPYALQREQRATEGTTRWYEPLQKHRRNIGRSCEGLAFRRPFPGSSITSPALISRFLATAASSETQ